MTATPHNGKEEDFQLFLSLLDEDRFYVIEDGVHKVDPSDLMRRMDKGVGNLTDAAFPGTASVYCKLPTFRY